MSQERHEEKHAEEQEQTPYYLAARYAGERPAGRAYFEGQETILRADCDLSVFRFQLNRVWHVAVLGEKPPDDLEDKLKTILSRGTPAPLPPEVLQTLASLRANATRQGPWVERHFRPGQRL